MEKGVRELIRIEFNLLKKLITNDIKLEIQLLRTELLAKLNEITTIVAYTGVDASKPQLEQEANCDLGLQEFEMLDVKATTFDDLPVSVDDDDDDPESTDGNNDDPESANGNDDNSESASCDGDCDIRYGGDELMLPIHTVKDLDEIEAQIRNGAKDKYIAEFTNILKTFGPNNILDKIFDENFIMEMNIDGIQGKIPLKNYTYLLNALYDAVKKCMPTKTHDEFIADIRIAFRLHKGKMHKRACLRANRKKNTTQDGEGTAKKAVKDSIDTIIQLAETQMQQDESKYKRRSTFPLKTFAEVENFNASINDTNRNEYIQILKTFLSFSGLRKSFDRLLHRDLIMHYNFGGQKGKLPFKVYTNLLNLLYEALVEDKERISEKDFHQELQNSFRTFKGRVNKRNSVARKRMSTQRELTAPTFSTYFNDESQDDLKPPSISHHEEEQNPNANQIPTSENGRKYKHKFPLKTPFNLEMMNKMITPENRHKYVKKLREMMKYGGISKGFTRFMSEELILQYNLRGQKNKRSFQDLTNVVDVLFEAATELKDGSTLDSFLSDLQAIFNKHKNSIHKKRSIERMKRRKLEMEDEG